MNGILVDSNILLDIFLDDPKWGPWSEEQLESYGASHHLYINSIIYAEISIGFSRIEDLEQTLTEGGFIILPIQKEALFFSGEDLSPVPEMEGNKTLSPPGFFIGAHAEIESLPLLTRDQQRYQTYYPHMAILGP